MAIVLPPGDAQRSRTRSPGCASDDQRHQLRGFVLDDERVRPAAAQRIARRDDQAVRRVARRLGLDVVGRESASCSCSRVTRSVLARSVSGGGIVVEPHPALGRVEADSDRASARPASRDASA